VNPAILIKGPSVASTNVPVNFSANVTDQNPTATYTYQWFVNGQPATSPSPSPNFIFTPSAAGVTAVSVTVLASDGGAATATTSLLVTSPVPQAGIVGAPTNGTVGLPITLGEASTDPSLSSSLTYNWSVKLGTALYALPPGTVTDAATFTFSPTLAGSYQVT